MEFKPKKISPKNIKWKEQVQHVAPKRTIRSAAGSRDKNSDLMTYEPPMKNRLFDFEPLQQKIVEEVKLENQASKNSSPTEDLPKLVKADTIELNEAPKEAVKIDVKLVKQPSNICKFCMKGIQKDEPEMLLQSTDCFHIVHLSCFKQRSIKALINNEPLKCPECNMDVSSLEMKGMLLPEELEKIEEEQMKMFYE